MSIEDELNELERRQVDAFAAWNQVRLFGSAVPMSHRRGLGFLAHIPLLRHVLLGVQRVRYARALADAQRELNLIALERASRLTQLVDIRGASVDQQLTQLDQRTSPEGQRMTAIDQRMSAIDQRVTSLHDYTAVVHRDVGKAMSEIHDRIDTTTSYVTYQSGELRKDFFELDEAMRMRLKHAEAQLSIQDRRLGELEERSRLQASHIRSLEQGRQVQVTDNSESPSNHPLAGDLLPRLIARLEQHVPELTRTQRVGITIQDGAADDMIALQSAYFGERLDTKDTRNDVWYHVDFTDAWNRAILFENALSKLEPAGYFVLISAPGNVNRAGDLAPGQVLSEVFDVTPTVRASVHIWRRPADNGAHG